MNLLQRRIDKLEAKRRRPPRIVFEPVVAVPLDGPIEHHWLANRREEAAAQCITESPQPSTTEARPM